MRGEGAKKKMKICFQRDSNPRPALHDRLISALDRSATLVRYQVEDL